jgi:hypothetical protein
MTEEEWTKERAIMYLPTYPRVPLAPKRKEVRADVLARRGREQRRRVSRPGAAPTPRRARVSHG